MNKLEYIPKIIVASFYRELTNDEKRIIDNWLSESPDNLKLYNKIIQGKFIPSKVDFYKNIDIVSDYIAVREKSEKRGSRKLIIKYLKYAALILLPFITFLFYTYIDAGQENKSKHEVLNSHGEAKAHIILASGEKLSFSQKDTILSCNNIKISARNNILKYEDLSSEISNTYNTLVVPRGGEYKLILDDGTNVWVNSESKLRYPIRFDKDNRKVFLEGEAYFDVKKDEKRPFKVIMKETELKVLGTAFNIKAYKDDNNIQATLVNGKITLSNSINSDKVVVIHPNHQAIVHRNGDIEVNEVDVKYYTSWINGRISFKDAKLEDIMNSVSRWYDIEVFYLNKDLKDVRYTGNIKRYSNFNDVVKLLEMTGVIKFKIKGKNVIIRKK